MDTLRKPLFIVAVVLAALVVLLELGALGVLEGAPVSLLEVQGLLPDGEVKDAFEDLDDDQRNELSSLAGKDKPPGLGIPYLALLDGLVLFAVALVGASLIIPESVHGKTQGVATLIFSIVIILAAVAMILAALAAVIAMLSLLLAVPFGTITYLALFGFFNRGGASVALSLLMLLKLGFAASLVLAQPRFLQNKGLVLLVLTAVLGNVIISFLHGFVPGFLVSITDAVAAIIVGILAALWAIFFLIGSLGSVVKAVS
ncbi:MAG: hypothetical protein AB1791_11940 [Chloroflexota bacterium]